MTRIGVLYGFFATSAFFGRISEYLMNSTLIPWRDRNHKVCGRSEQTTQLPIHCPCSLESTSTITARIFYFFSVSFRESDSNQKLRQIGRIPSSASSKLISPARGTFPHQYNARTARRVAFSKAVWSARALMRQVKAPLEMEFSDGCVWFQAACHA